MAKFRKILRESFREYHYRIKSVTPITDDMYRLIKNSIQKYRPSYVSKVKKTIHQDHPLDFGDLENAEVYLIDLSLGLPVSSYILLQELRVAARIPEKNIVVRHVEEGMEVQEEDIKFKLMAKQKAKDEGFLRGSLLRTNPEYYEYETAVPQQLMAGDTYTEHFKEYLAKVAFNRKDTTYFTGSGLFKELENRKNDDDDADDYLNNFNADIKDAPRVYPKWGPGEKDLSKLTDEEKAMRQITSNWGNFWTTKTHSKPYKDFIDELEIALTTPELKKVRKKYAKGKKND